MNDLCVPLSRTERVSSASSWFGCSDSVCSHSTLSTWPCPRNSFRDRRSHLKFHYHSTGTFVCSDELIWAVFKISFVHARNAWIGNAVCNGPHRLIKCLMSNSTSSQPFESTIGEICFGSLIGTCQISLELNIVWDTYRIEFDERTDCCRTISHCTSPRNPWRSTTMPSDMTPPLTLFIVTLWSLIWRLWTAASWSSIPSDTEIHRCLSTWIRTSSNVTSASIDLLFVTLACIDRVLHQCSHRALLRQWGEATPSQSYRSISSGFSFPSTFWFSTTFSRSYDDTISRSMQTSTTMISLQSFHRWVLLLLIEQCHCSCPSLLVWSINMSEPVVDASFQHRTDGQSIERGSRSNNSFWSLKIWSIAFKTNLSASSDLRISSKDRSIHRLLIEISKKKR